MDTITPEQIENLNQIFSKSKEIETDEDLLELANLTDDESEWKNGPYRQSLQQLEIKIISS